MSNCLLGCLLRTVHTACVEAITTLRTGASPSGILLVVITSDRASAVFDIDIPLYCIMLLYALMYAHIMLPYARIMLLYARIMLLYARSMLLYAHIMLMCACIMLLYACIMLLYACSMLDAAVCLLKIMLI